jgi:hypothetical protein
VTTLDCGHDIELSEARLRSGRYDCPFCFNTTTAVRDRTTPLSRLGAKPRPSERTDPPVYRGMSDLAQRTGPTVVVSYPSSPPPKGDTPRRLGYDGDDGD